MELNIKEPFVEQYVMIVESNMKAINIHLISRTLMRWDFNVLKVNDYQIELRLILLENKLLDSNNPIVKDIYLVSQLFSKIYGELHLILNMQGKVIDILNKDTIIEKWKELKSDISYNLENESIRDIIKLNDGMFSNPEKVKAAVQANDLLMAYFANIYGHRIPYKGGVTKSNFFNTTNVDWAFFYKSMGYNKEEEGNVHIKVEGHPSFYLTRLFYSNAYSQFRDKIDIHKLNTELKEEANYQINEKTGRLIEASIIRREIADPENLYVEYAYELMCNDIFKEKMRIKDLEDEEFESQMVYKTYRGREYTKEEWEKLEDNPWTNQEIDRE
ncbi:hypothetical protein [Prevotella intermedia]|uniref:Uncharacterized protein n=3 Tax=Prevotella TaxID=838 RepID=A0A3R7VZP0_PREIN|nr:hypothetical protein [Prevotella intermedia]RQE00795.1 hypothetical protein D2S53_11310 [Prevotella intermedia]RRF86406.1 hypothetical protein D2S45_11440 [Prevotella intermedia]